MFDRYKLIGRSYDLMSKAYSGNAILNCKLAMLREDTIASGSKILFAGAGHGRDAIRAAELGAQVTMLDISPTMMAKFEQHLSSHPRYNELQVELILGDILKHEKFEHYDMVVANFFLNVFDRNKMNTLLDHLIKLCRPKGKVLIGDFCLPNGGIIQRTLQQIYWYSAAIAFCAFAGNAIHSIYDYRGILEGKGLLTVEHQFFPLLGKNFFHAILAEKP